MWLWPSWLISYVTRQLTRLNYLNQDSQAKEHIKEQGDLFSFYEKLSCDDSRKKAYSHCYIITHETQSFQEKIL